jgi:hypothetical protein
MPPDGSTRAGTAGGTLLVLLQLMPGEVMKTTLLAFIGAMVSFGTSLLLKYIVKWWRKRGL